VTVSANLDLVRSIYADWERGDFSSAKWADPEIEYVQVGGLAPGSWTGLAGMAEAMRGVLGAWEGFRVAAVECRELDDERVLVFTRSSGRGKASGVDLGQIGARERMDVLRIRDGKVTTLITYADRDRALADLGLVAEAVPQESTTPGLVERWQSSFAAINRGDYDAFMSFWGPDPVSFMSDGGLGTFEGRAAVRRFFEDWISSYEEFEVVAEEIVDLGNGVTYAILSQRGRPVGSSGEVRLRYASVGLSVNGLAVQVTNYLDIDKARAVAERLAQERG
jgi:ketosteroid isomerase-like protein